MDTSQPSGPAPDIRFVLVEPSHPGNIGAAARALKVMGWRRLVLVRPARFPDPEATARASGADDVLAGAMVCAGLGEALADCSLVLATTARSRRLPWPLLEPRRAAGRAVAAPGPVALVFGRERSGLRNEELERCHAAIEIPTAPDYRSLNLAAAVQVLAYELRRAWLDRVGAGDGTDAAGPMPDAAAAGRDGPPVGSADMEGLFRHLERVLVQIGFLDPQAPRRLMPRLRRLFQRAAPDRGEMDILRGILRAVERHCGQDGGKADA